MNIKQETASKLRKQLKIEISSKNLYRIFVKRIKDKKIDKNINSIIKDELKHIGIVKELIGLVEGYKEPLKAKSGEAKKDVEAKDIDFLGFIKEFSSVFITVPIDKISSSIIRIIKKFNMHCLYISFNKIPRYIKKELAYNGVNIKNIQFITCVKIKKNKDIVIDPEALTEISIVLSQCLEKMPHNCFILVDTISAFQTYHSIDTILRFVSSINTKVAEKGSGVIWVSIKSETDKTLNNKIAPLCDKVIYL